MYFNNDNQGYSRGGIDVTTAVNLFFKFLLLSPIFLLAGYVSIAMLKHMIFHGVPTMNAPTPEQVQNIKERDERIGLPPVTQVTPPVTEVVPPVIVEPVVRPVIPAPVSTEVRSVRLGRALSDVTGGYEASQFKAYCEDQWLPRYGYIAAARGGPCDQYRWRWV